MSLAVRSCLIIVGIIVWFMLALGSGARRNRGGAAYTVNRWYHQPGTSETPYQECEGGTVPVVGRLTRVEVVGCETDPCVLKGGSNATFKLNFVSQANVTGVEAIVHGVIGSIPVPFHIPHPDGCTESGLTCPIVAGQEYAYATTIPVLKNYPKMSVKVKWELRADKASNLVCVIIPARIG